MAENSSLRSDSPAARWACALVIAALVAVIYAPVRHHEFLDYDDMAYLVWDPAIEPASLRHAFASAFQKQWASNWTPLAVLTHQLDRALWGREPAGALLGNVALHALGSVVLLFALYRLTGRLAASAWIAAVHAVHPLHVESVAWAIERKDVLSGFWFAALLWCHARYAAAPSTGRNAALLACLGLGLLSKPMLVTAPFVLLLLDYWPLRRLGRTAIAEKLPMFIMVAVISWITWQMQFHTGAFSYGTSVPRWARGANAVDALVAYLADAFWPAQLAAYYPHPGTSLGAIRILACAALLGAITLAAWLQRKPRPWLLVGWLWFVGMLVPVLGLVQVGMQARADRYTYLPLVGLSIATAWGVTELARARGLPRRALGAAALGAVAALAVATRVQLRHWKDTVTLFSRAVEVSPESAVVQHALGLALVNAGDALEARTHLERAIELGAESAEARAGLAVAYEELGRYPESIAQARSALRLAPGQRYATLHLVRVLATGPDPELRDPDEAVHLAEALRDAHHATPEADVYEALAMAYASAGRRGDALRSAEQALILVEVSGDAERIAATRERVARYRAAASAPP